MSAQEDFFSNLPALEQFTEVLDTSRYANAPDDWSLIITDVKGSTQAIEAGRYKDVNALGVASIVALRNAMPEIDLPFVFGGDGATILAPSSRVEQFSRALRGIQEMSSRSFELEMRAGVVPISELREAGHEVRVGRYRLSPHVFLAMLAGDGVTVGETWIKDPVNGARYEVTPDGERDADFSGFECRWQPVESRNGLVVSLLVQAREGGAETYQQVIDRIDSVLTEKVACPVRPDALKLSGVSARYDQETRIRGRGMRWIYRLRARLQTQIGRFLLWSGIRAGGFDGKAYKDEVVLNTDYRKFDDTLRMVLDMSAGQLGQLEQYLTEQQEAGRIVYGLHTSSSAMLTCVIDQYVGKHLHFVDGSDGGYALAAKQMKAQLKQTP